MQPEPAEKVWVDEDAGPVVRHYAMTAGRTQPTLGKFDLITQVMAQRATLSPEPNLHPEHALIVQLCQVPTSVAEIATTLDLPVGTVRVLLGDLLNRGYIRTRSPIPAAAVPNVRVFKAVLDGLRAL